MMGDLFLGGGLAFSLGAMLLYALRPETKWARLCTWLSAVAAVLASTCLMMLIFGNHFDIAYVASYSSRELPDIYKFSAFWAGQQGSFLLWLLIHAVVGCILCREKITAAGMSVYMLIQSMITILVLAKSPFLPQEPVVEKTSDRSFHIHAGSLGSLETEGASDILVEKRIIEDPKLKNEWKADCFRIQICFGGNTLRLVLR